MSERCDGSGTFPVRTGITPPIHGQKYPAHVIGLCDACGGWVKLNALGKVRYHRSSERARARRNAGRAFRFGERKRRRAG